MTNKDMQKSITSMAVTMHNLGIELNIIASALYNYIEMNDDIEKFKEFKKEEEDGKQVEK